MGLFLVMSFLGLNFLLFQLGPILWRQVGQSGSCIFLLLLEGLEELLHLGVGVGSLFLEHLLESAGHLTVAGFALPQFFYLLLLHLEQLLQL